ncbi:MAG TPA: SMC-Scp complex subunit ScpB, partial [Oleiagrimonas sp.]|nr:SMC-Scp complex subunit ScpB [Oleiagrimonas sp.]
SGFRFQVRQEIHPWVARMWTERPSRYSRALLETLALVAYRQPITRGEIEQVRGVTVSSHIIKTLEEREWIRVVGHRDAPGRPALFGTTRTFLDYFNLKSLDELPPLADILNLDALDPQLAFEDGSAQVGPPPAAEASSETTTDADARDESDAEADTDTSPDIDEAAEAVATDTEPSLAEQENPEEDRA